MQMPLVIDENGDVSIHWSLEDAQRSMEVIDVRNSEYVGYDAAGRLLSIVARNSQQIEISLAENQPSHIQDLERVLRRYLTESPSQHELKELLDAINQPASVPTQPTKTSGMAVTRALAYLVYCEPFYGFLRFCAVPFIALRLFGYLFFAATTSDWATVPALVLIALVPTSNRPFQYRPVIAATLFAAYLCSVYFYGWEMLKLRQNEGEDSIFEAVEAAIVLLLTLRCFLRGTKQRL